MDNQQPYPIEDAARRSGLSVSALRFYADAGIVEPTHLSEAGHRMYDVDAIARLELVRTLRELDTDLQQIRRLLEGGTTLHDLLTTHLTIVEKLDVPEGFVDRLRELRPRLPDDPTLDQLRAWIELGDLVGDPLFRQEVRTGLHLDHGPNGAGRKTAAAPVQELVHDVGPAIFKRDLDLYQAGEDPRSAKVPQVIVRLLEVISQYTDQRPSPKLRDHMAEGYRQLSDLIRQDQEQGFAPPSSAPGRLHPVPGPGGADQRTPGRRRDRR